MQKLFLFTLLFLTFSNIVYSENDVESNILKLQETGSCVDCNLEKAWLYGSSISNSKLSYSNLKEADISISDLRYSDLRYANLTGVNLSDTDLSYVDLSYANLNYANLSGANLTNTILNSDTSFENAIFCFTLTTEGLNNSDCDF